MAFLDAYNYLSSPQQQKIMILNALRGDWRNLFYELRSNRPVFETPLFTMITRWGDILQVLTQPELFSVKENTTIMTPTMGTFMLSQDGNNTNWQEKAIMQSILSWDDLPRIRHMVASDLSKALIKKNNTINIVSDVGRYISLKIVQDYFGFSGDCSTMLSWSKATQHGMFRNSITHDPEVQLNCIKAGQEMQLFARKLIRQKSHSLSKNSKDSISRLIYISTNTHIKLPIESVISNICGLLIGTIETMSQSITQSLEQILIRPDILSKAVDAARSNNNNIFDAIVWEALRFNPSAPFIIRTCERDTILAQGTNNETKIPKGTRLAVCLASAMFDPVGFPEPDSFKLDRAFSSYLHFGFGAHECLGKYISKVVVPEAVRQVLLLPGIHQLPGEEGKIDFKKGPFPEQYLVSWNKNS